MGFVGISYCFNSVGLGRTFNVLSALWDLCFLYFSNHMLTSIEQILHRSSNLMFSLSLQLVHRSTSGMALWRLDDGFCVCVSSMF